jgi:hypothetical protein
MEDLDIPSNMYFSIEPSDLYSSYGFTFGAL